MCTPKTFRDAEAIRASSFARHIEIFDELGSTNDRAAELCIRRDIELPALVVARRQTAGRGRGKHQWWASDGALTFSVLIDPSAFDLTTRDWPRLSLTTAVAICAALTEHLARPTVELADLVAEFAKNSGPGHKSVTSRELAYSPRLAIKWPNDVFLDGAKVAGILIESPGGPSPARGRMIIGIGINVNNSRRFAPREAGPHVTALCDASGTTHELDGVLVSVLRALEAFIGQLASSDPALPATWQRLCWLTEQEVEVDSGSEILEGTCLGIAMDGSLIVNTASGLRCLYSGSVKAL